MTKSERITLLIRNIITAYFNLSIVTVSKTNSNIVLELRTCWISNKFIISIFYYARYGREFKPTL